VSTYPSRAADAAGRRGFLEKQVLEWHPEGDLPAAAAGFVLLSEAASFDDADWWPRREEASWSEPDFVLALDACSRPLSPRRLVEEVEKGRQELLESGVGEDQLTELYGGILGSLRPARLEGLGASLPPRALASLLLPLPRSTADRLSLTGWIPSSRGNLEDLGQRWDAVVCPPECRTSAAVGDVDGLFLKAAQILSRALLDGDPGPLKGFEIPASLTWEEWTAAMYRDLGRTTDRLIEQGLWKGWRAQATLPPRERLTTAMAWLTSDVWSRPGAPVPSRETWEYVLGDVGSLDRKRMKQLCAGPEGRHTWPWIPRHEAKQLEDLEQMVTDPEAAELLARSIEPERGRLLVPSEWSGNE
jgi:hypothetical protein